MLFDRRLLIVGNWKMNGLKFDGLPLAEALVKKHKELLDCEFDMVICPPFTLLTEVGNAISNSAINLGAQNCHALEKGSHTGDISSLMLAELGCQFVIVGHADQRTDHGENNSEVKAKAAAVNKAGMTSIICIGETEEEHDAGKTFEVVKKQMSGSLPVEGAMASNTVIAYEPVWAIGTGRAPSSEQVQEVHSLIRFELDGFLNKSQSSKIRILYGGSLNAGNARELLSLKDVDGGLIGGASLNAEEFWAISQSCV
jgi:triosephosphate isomerase